MRQWLMGLVLSTVLAGCAGALPPTVMSSFDGQAGGDQSGGLQLLVIPDDADVYVDAIYHGKAHDFTGNNGLWLDRGLHAVEVRRDGYLTFFRQVQVTHGLLEVLVFSLQEDTEQR